MQVPTIHYVSEHDNTTLILLYSINTQGLFNINSWDS